ncbi:glutamate receptor U1-like [Dermacentor andersoni]|uniref:glutamate receptor U1-like n=1 Tax=Dermacentor andersoni TaxID=34620 RepID=UPI003B3B3B49
MSTVVMQPDGTPRFAGISGFMFDLVVEAMGFKYVVKLPPDYSWGARDAQGRWAGQFGMVVRNESDMLVGPVAPTEDRHSALEPLPQFYYTEAGHCGGLTDPYVTNVFGYVNSFDVDVWIGLFTAMLFVSFVVALIDARFRCTRLAVAYYFAFLSLFSIFLMEASARVTRGSAKRWLIGTWWLAVFVLAAGFTGHMKASLTMKDPRARYDTIQDIVQSRDVVPVIIRGTTYEERFRNSLDIYQRQVWVKARRMGGIMPVKDVFSKETFDDVLQSKKVVFLDQTLLYHALTRLYDKPPQGEFYMGREIAMNLTMGMWVNRGLPVSLRKTLHQRTRWIIESGLPEWNRLSIIQRAKQRSQTGTPGAQSFAFHTIRVEDVSGLFYLMVACFSVCLPAALLEHVTSLGEHRCRRRRAA